MIVLNSTHSDLRIFREELKHKLLVDEFMIANSGYSDERYIQPPGHSHPRRRLLSLIRAQHENLNKRLKQFGVLKQKFRHDP